MTRRQLLDALDEEELVDQIAFEELEPMPNWWEMWACLFEMQRHRKPHEQFNHEQWLPGEREVKPMTANEIRAAFMAVSRPRKRKKH